MYNVIESGGNSWRNIMSADEAVRRANAYIKYASVEQCKVFQIRGENGELCAYIDVDANGLRRVVYCGGLRRALCCGDVF